MQEHCRTSSAKGEKEFTHASARTGTYVESNVLWVWTAANEPARERYYQTCEAASPKSVLLAPTCYWEAEREGWRQRGRESGWVHPAERTTTQLDKWSAPPATTWEAPAHKDTRAKSERQIEHCVTSPAVILAPLPSTLEPQHERLQIHISLFAVFFWQKALNALIHSV